MSFGQVFVYRRVYGSISFSSLFFACQLFRSGYQCTVVDSSHFSTAGIFRTQFRIGIYCGNGNKLSDWEWWLHYFTIYHFYSLRCNSYLDVLFQHSQALLALSACALHLLRRGFIQQRRTVRSLDKNPFISPIFRVWTRLHFPFRFFPLSHAEMCTKTEQCVEKKKWHRQSTEQRNIQKMNKHLPSSYKRSEWKFRMNRTKNYE